MATEVKSETSAALGKPVKRSNKPLMERRRRERINNSLEILKKLVLESLKKDTSQYSKLEKADILEMTVKHLRNVQREQLTLAAATDSTVINKYRAGFTECAQEVTRYLGQVQGLHPEARHKLEHHLNGCIQQCHLPDSNQSQLQVHSMATNQQLQQQQQLPVGIPAATVVSSLPGTAAASHPASLMQHQQQQQQKHQQLIPVLNSHHGQQQLMSAYQMVPGTIMGSDVTLLLPASQVCSPMTSPNDSLSRSASVSPSSGRSSPATTPSSSSSLSSSSPRDGSSCSNTPSPVSHHHHQMAHHHVTKTLQQVAPAHNNPVNLQVKEEKVWRPW